MHPNAQSPLHTFPRNFPINREAGNLLQTCCGLVSNTANNSATSHCSGIWKMTRHNKHNRLLPAQTCYGLVDYVADLLGTCYSEVTNLLRTKLLSCYGETGVMDSSLNSKLGHVIKGKLQCTAAACFSRLNFCPPTNRIQSTTWNLPKNKFWLTNNINFNYCCRINALT